MGFLDSLLGRTKPVQPKLDDLFGLPSAAITLQAASIRFSSRDIAARSSALGSGAASPNIELWAWRSLMAKAAARNAAWLAKSPRLMPAKS